MLQQLQCVRRLFGHLAEVRYIPAKVIDGIQKRREDVPPVVGPDDKIHVVGF